VEEKGKIFAQPAGPKGAAGTVDFALAADTPAAPGPCDFAFLCFRFIVSNPARWYYCLAPGRGRDRVASAFAVDRHVFAGTDFR
jgi:hypothetical protein